MGKYTVIQRTFYFHSFLIDMFFSLSFCITWWRQQNSVNRWVLGEMFTNLAVWQTLATAISKSSWVTWTLLSLRAYMPASVQTPWKYTKVWNVWAPEILPQFTCYWANSHLNLSTRGSRHQLCYLPQIDASSQIHFSGVDLQDVQTGLLMSNQETLRDVINSHQVCGCAVSKYLFIWRGELNLPVNPARPEQSRVQDVNTVCGHNDLGRKRVATHE